ncbi:MAG: bifunctional enoyl-CoA hydratase/phosphate acetyltransferase [Candidatus Eremiobacteraeota bacterium]|nr:bifunctional enoyl-CoA hydratase/phosphate acetyltransferase [Candidatus Eremiobacteraeota bacterium]
MIKSMQDVLDYAKKCPSQKIAVVAPEDESSLLAIQHAIEEDVAEAILVGSKKLIEDEMKKIGMGFSKVEILDVADHDSAAKRSVELVHRKEAALLMKGNVHTDCLLKAVLDKDVGLRKGTIMSHAFAMQSPRYHKLFFLTDVAMNIAPTLDQKVQILQNVIELVHDIFEVPLAKVAVLGAVETVNPKMPCTYDAACLSKMSERGQIKHAIVDGPLAFDNAISSESAKIKGIDSPVAGDPDILLFPEIESGNVVYKALMYLADCQSAGIILGARAPIVLTSRADDMKTKLNSIALCAIASLKARERVPV